MIRVYTYETKEDMCFKWDYFEESTKVQNIFENEIKRFPKADNIFEADIAFFPLTLATAFQHQRSPHLPLSKQPNLQYLWRTVYSKRIADKETRKKVPHFMLFPYVLFNVNVSFIPDDIFILCYETEVTVDIYGTLANFGCLDRMITIPYFASSLHSFPTTSRKRCCFVGHLNHAEPFRNKLVNIFKKHFQLELHEPSKGMNYSTLYASYELALVLRGDTPTRNAFYQAIQANTVPVIYRHCLVHYGHLYGGSIPIHDMCLVLPDDGTEEEIVRAVTMFLESKYCHAFATLCKFRNMLSYTHHTQGVVSPVYHALKTIPNKIRNFKSPSKSSKSLSKSPSCVFVVPLPPEYNRDLLPVHISTMDCVKGTFASQYELEIMWHTRILKDFIITRCVERADFVFIPLYTFLCGWKDMIFNHSTIVSIVSLLINHIPSWKQCEHIPHVLVYSDVCWNTLDFFANRIQWPKNTVLISMESISLPCKTITCPYLSGLETYTLAPHKRPMSVVYIGRMRAPFVAHQLQPENCKFHFVEMEGWKSISQEVFLKQCNDLYQSSVFSLQPPGDRGTRRGFFQSLICGCIPVVFQDNKDSYSHVPLTEIAIVIDQCVTDISTEQIVDFLDNIPFAKIKELQQNIARHRTSFIFEKAYARPIMRITKQIVSLRT
jgi:hypothetical protein